MLKYVCGETCILESMKYHAFIACTWLNSRLVRGGKGRILLELRPKKIEHGLQRQGKWSVKHSQGYKQPSLVNFWVWDSAAGNSILISCFYSIVILLLPQTFSENMPQHNPEKSKTSFKNPLRTRQSSNNNDIHELW